MKSILHTLLVSLLWLVPLFAQAQEQERIIRFHSDIVIEADGKITVSESIRVYGGESDIRRGIMRSIPLYRSTKSGNKEKVNFKVVSVYRDGNKEEYKTKDSNGYREIYVGNADVWLDPGIYDYTIVYESYGHIGFFEDFDELYWNVTGTEWGFKIEESSATIHLPEGASPINTACYTGAYSSTASDCQAEVTDGVITFQSQGPLDYYEGLTVAVSFTPFIVKRPPPPSAGELFWLQYRTLILSILFTVLMLGYYFFTWRKVGIDPEKPVIIPTFNPPHGWSPATVRYLYKRGVDNKAFTAALVSMAVKGIIRISKQSKNFQLETTGKEEKLSGEETKIYNKLFTRKKGTQSITVSDDYHQKFSAANNALSDSLTQKWNLKDFFLHNSKYVVWGVLLVILFMILYFILTGEGGSFFMLLFLIPFIGAGAFVLYLSTEVKGIGRIPLFIIGGMFTIIPTIAAIGIMSSEESIITSLFGATMCVLLTIYFFLIKAPTLLGAQTKSELEGFRMYLKTAEENRLNLLTPPERTPELFEQYLPYAIALNVENEWGKKFDDVLKAASYSPEWYTDNKPFTSGLLTSTLSKSFSSSIGSAQIDPAASSDSRSSGSSSWSSGSSGGGFSGGGGGGGGGGGW